MPRIQTPKQADIPGNLSIPNRGGPKGVKLTQSVKESVGLVFEKMGGVNGYAKWAAKNPDKFYDHYMKILPVELRAEVNVTADFSNILEAARMRALPEEKIVETVAQTLVSQTLVSQTLAEESNDERLCRDSTNGESGT